MSTQQYTKEVINKIWQMAPIIQGYNPAIMRQDKCGAVILYDHYGNRNSHYGWEIDHIKPLARGGTDTWDNVQPLHWSNNASKGDGVLVCSTNWSNQ